MGITIDKPGDERRGSSVTDLRTNQREVSTFLHHAQAAINDEAGGRFARVQPQILIGADPIPRYPALSSGPWSGSDPVGQEPSLGFSIDDLASPAGLSLSPAATGPAPAAPSVNRPDESRGAGPLSSKEESDGA
jgi:hypothetical protein